MTARPDSRPAQAAAPRRARVVLDWVRSIAIGFALFLLLRTFLVQTFRITSGSMEGTLLVGDFLVLNKSAYGATVPGTRVRLPGLGAPDIGDIVVFRGRHEHIDLVKRLVGLPGDTLAMRGRTLYRNGLPLDEPYVRWTDPDGDGFHPWMRWQADHLPAGTDRDAYRPTRDVWGPIIVPEGRYFVLGDNRDESLDSRYWGFVEESTVKGKAVLLYFSVDGRPLNGGVPVLRQVRWNRIGERLR
jgi:signal peptidase I